MIDSRHEEELTAISCPDSTGHLTLYNEPDGTGNTRQTTTHEESNARLTNGYKHIPPDGGWGWVVLAGSIFILVFLIGTSTCFGVLFSGKMDHLGASSTTVSWIFSISGIVGSVGVGVTDNLTKRFGHRPVAFVCCLVASLSFMLLAFTNSLASITVLYGVIILMSSCIGSTVAYLIVPLVRAAMSSGIGSTVPFLIVPLVRAAMSSGIGSTVPFLIVPLYFEKQRGRAMAALITGAPLGGIVLPLLLRGLQDHFGFAGAVLLHGAFMAHCCVAAALFRPVTRTCNNKTVCPERFSIEEQKENKRRASPFSLSQIDSKSSEDSVLLQVLNNEISEDRSRQDQNDIIEDAKLEDSENIFSKTNIEEHRKHKRRRPCGPLHNQLMKLMKKTLAILNQRQLILLGLCHALSIISYYNLLMLVPFALEFSGHSSQVSARALSVASLANLVTRLVVALVADSKWFNRRVALMLGLFIVTLFTFVFSMVTTSLPGVLVSMVGVGVGIGLAISLVYTVMLDMLGLQLYATCIGFSAILEVIIFISIGPAIGALRDWSGAYGWSVCACAVLQLCSALLLLPLSCAQAHDSNIRLKKHQQKDAS